MPTLNARHLSSTGPQNWCLGIRPFQVATPHGVVHVVEILALDVFDQIPRQTVPRIEGVEAICTFLS